jgi:hypothetical protein
MITIDSESDLLDRSLTSPAMFAVDVETLNLLPKKHQGFNPNSTTVSELS